MLGNTYEKENCSIARSLELVGERWSLLILRNAIFAGMTRFSDFQKSLGLAPNVLTKRLESFVENKIMSISKGETEYLEYHLTEKGMDFARVLISLREWGDDWAAPDGPPVVLKHKGCGGKVSQKLCCQKCDKTLSPQALIVQPSSNK